jgi:hypothetical protein
MEVVEAADCDFNGTEVGFASLVMHQPFPTVFIFPIHE